MSSATYLHDRLAEIAPAALPRVAESELAIAAAHAEAGCSRCARALLNARETGADLAIAEAPPVKPNLDLRQRVLASVRGRGGDAIRGAEPRGDHAPRFFDPAGEVARLHMGTADDAARTAEIDALVAALPREGDACEQLLAQISRISGFPLLFVSVVRGERVGYRVQRGLDVRFAEFRDRRRETTFCTHTISCGGPLIVPNAAEEAFFRGSNMVVRFGVYAYVGVPLTTSRGITIGTVCAMDFRARASEPAIVRLLELFTQPVLAEIERERLSAAEQLARTASGAPLHAEPWMRALLDVELSLARAAARPSTLVVARAGAGLSGAVDEPIGRIASDTIALLLPGVERAEAELRAAEMERAAAARGETIVLGVEPSTPHASGAAWCEAAARRA